MIYRKTHTIDDVNYDVVKARCNVNHRDLTIDEIYEGCVVPSYNRKGELIPNEWWFHIIKDDVGDVHVIKNFTVIEPYTIEINGDVSIANKSEKKYNMRYILIAY